MCNQIKTISFAWIFVNMDIFCTTKITGNENCQFYLHFVEVFYIPDWREAFQLTFSCSKSIIETLEKGVKYVQS